VAVKNIVFDVGRVLVEWKPEVAMEKLGFSQDAIRALNHAFFTTGYWNETDRGVMSDEEILALFVQEAPEYEKEIYEFWENMNLAIWQFPYAKEWIWECKAAGYGCYVLSNYGKHAFECTKKELDFVPLMDGTIFSYEVKLIKPDVAIFHALCEKYDLIPEECVFIDDLTANVEAARKSGMQGIVFTGLEDVKRQLRELQEKES